MTTTLHKRWRMAVMLVVSGFYCVPALALPDWGGVWAMTGGTVFDAATRSGPGGSTTPGLRQRPPYTAEYEAKYLANMALRDKGVLPDPNSMCGIPAGFPRIFNLPDVYEFAVTDKQVWILSENGPNVLRIYTDGRAHPPVADRWPTHTGDSVGHWEGDTLVFDTLSLHSSESGNTMIDRTGLILSDAAHVVTRMHIAEGDVMVVEMTIEDAKALTAPWVVTKRFNRQPAGTRVYDYACNENNRNPIDPATGWTYTIGPDGKIMDQSPSAAGSEE